MNRRTGLGRHIPSEDATGDPLDGLVNLFDIGIVLAVAFLIAGIGLTINHATGSPSKRAATHQQSQTLPSITNAPSASGRGRRLGSVYRLANGQLVYVQTRPRGPQK